MTTAKLSSKNQVVVPREVRQALGIGPGDEIVFVPRAGGIMVMVKPKDVVRALRGSGKGLYGDVAEYLRRERASWTSKKSRRF